MGGTVKLNMSIIRTGNIITVSNGRRSRQKAFATETDAKALETSFTNNPAAGAKWLSNDELEPLGLPADVARRVLEVR